MQNENGVLAEQEEIHNALVDKYVPIWDKKYRSKGESIWVFQRILCSSAEKSEKLLGNYCKK